MSTPRCSWRAISAPRWRSAREQARTRGHARTCRVVCTRCVEEAHTLRVWVVFTLRPQVHRLVPPRGRRRTVQRHRVGRAACQRHRRHELLAARPDRVVAVALKGGDARLGVQRCGGHRRVKGDADRGSVRPQHLDVGGRRQHRQLRVETSGELGLR
eukprot:6115817-Prymnesium_polylepis.1